MAYGIKTRPFLVDVGLLVSCELDIGLVFMKDRRTSEEWRRLVGVEPITTRRTWLESVEANIAELEIDKEVFHDRKKWRRNVMKRKSSHPYSATSTPQTSHYHQTLYN